MKNLSLSLILICLLASPYFSQKLNEPELVGRWSWGEDFGEFIFHRVQLLNYYLKENPNGRIVARICSKQRMPVALVSTRGFAFQFLNDTRSQGVPDEKVYLARTSKCGGNIEQYWFVPENSNFQYDEIFLADKIPVTRLLIGYYEDAESKAAKKEFANNIKQFIEELKSNPDAQGFIVGVWNNKFVSRNIQKTLQQIKKDKDISRRTKIIRKKGFYTHYPELITVTIKK
jgi:hypothetical protein